MYVCMYVHTYIYVYIYASLGMYLAKHAAVGTVADGAPVHKI
jgi:hypothetical protein